MLRIMPRQQVLFDCFEQCIRAAAQASSLLAEMLKKPEEYPRFVTQIEACEQEGDRATALVVETLSKNLTTPFERLDIRALMETIDDIVDAVDAAAHKLVMYRAFQACPEAHELTSLLASAVVAVEKAVVALRTSRTAEAVLAPCREARQLENDADKVLRRGIGALFDELKDPFELIKWKEILEILECATDRCGDVAKIIEEVMRQHG